MEEKTKKPIYKKMWFWVLVIILIGIIASSSGSNKPENKTVDKYAKSDVEVSVVDLSTMTQAEIEEWCNSKKVNYSINNEYSDSVAKGNFVSQSVAPNATIHEGDKITIVYSLGIKPTLEQENALKKAESYSKNLHMSKKGIYEQLTSEYGEQFDADSAQYAIDNMQADFKANALEKAKSYQSSMNMSKSAIYDQLISEYGEQFTAEEAQYAIDNLE